MDFQSPQDDQGQTQVKDSVARRIIDQLKKENLQGQKIGNIIELIHAGSKSISKEDEEVYMVLGLTGAGKTTLTAYLSGVELVVKQEKLDPSKQISDKKKLDSDQSSDDEGSSLADRSKNYLDYKTMLEGYGKIGGSDLESETMIPNKFISGSGQIFWDCPGFQDSRGEEVDIANSNYIYKISKYAKKIKFVLVIDGSCLESKGFGQNKGDHFKVLLETLFQMSKDTTIDYSEQLTIIITRVSKSSKLDYFKQKLDTLFTELLGKNSFVEKLVKFFKKSDFEKFFDKLKKANVCLFRQPKGKDGETFGQEYRERIQKQLDKTKFYTGVNISVPHSIRSLERVIDLWKYTRNQLSSKFQKLCESLGKEVEQMSAVDYTKVSELIKQFEDNYQNSPLNSNSEFFSVIKNEFFIPLTNIIEQRYNISDESKELRKSLMEEIEFFLLEVYDGLLLGVRLSSNTEEFFGKISYYELQQGFSELYRAIRIKQSSIGFEQLLKLRNELNEQNISADQQKKLLEQELEMQAQLRDQLDKQQQELVKQQLETQYAIQNASQSTFMLQMKEDMAIGAKFGDTAGTIAGGATGMGGGFLSGAAMGSALGPLGTVVGGILGGLAGTGVGGLIGKGVGRLVGSGAGAITTGVQYVYEEVKNSRCSIF